MYSILSQRIISRLLTSGRDGLPRIAMGLSDCTGRTSISETQRGGGGGNPYVNIWLGHFMPTARSSASNTWSADPIIGAYTPVTKALWKDRLERHVGGATKGVPDPIDKHPELTSVRYPFTSDVEMLEMYRNPWGKVRMGRILEDMDSLAGNIAFKHCEDGDNNTLPPMLVTAAVERIHMLHPLNLDTDMDLSGQVVYTGSSSLDIRLKLHQNENKDPSMIALFTFVGRNPATQKSALVNCLIPSNPKEVSWFDERHKVAVDRKTERKRRASGTYVEDPAIVKQIAWAARLKAEAQVMKDMPGLSAGDALLMSQTQLCNTFTCQPQQRNMHGRIFGGFLMRRAYELAFATVHTFAGSRPRFVEVDQIDFKQPVDVGDLATFKSKILHTRNLLDHPDGPQGQVFVQVEAIVNRPELVTSVSTNIFNLTFVVDLVPRGLPASSGVMTPLKRILPSTPCETELVQRFHPTQNYDHPDSVPG